MTMTIFATFVHTTYMDDGALELAHAWDEYCWDANHEGFKESRQKALDSYGDELEAVVDTEIQVPMESLAQRLTPVVVRLDEKAISVVSHPATE